MKYKHLHHVDLPNHYQFITFRTHESLDFFLEKLTKQNKPNNMKQLEIDKYLDASNNGSYLNEAVLTYLYDFLINKNNELYELAAFNIMPNHVHLLFKPILQLTNVMQKLKGNSAYQINKMLNLKGRFWANNYYDKLIRDERHFNVVYNYIKNNHANLNEKDTVKRFYGVYE